MNRPCIGRHNEGILFPFTSLELLRLNDDLLLETAPFFVLGEFSIELDVDFATESYLGHYTSVRVFNTTVPISRVEFYPLTNMDLFSSYFDMLARHVAG